jgi:hypothetical protein
MKFFHSLRTLEAGVSTGCGGGGGGGAGGAGAGFVEGGIGLAAVVGWGAAFAAGAALAGVRRFGGIR